MRLRQFPVDLRGLDLRQQIALVDAGADVGVPALQIAAGSGIDRRLDVRLHDARQHQFIAGSAQLRFRRDHRRDGILRGALAQLRTSHQAAADAPHREHQGNDADDERVAANSALSAAGARDPARMRLHRASALSASRVIPISHGFSEFRAALAAMHQGEDRRHENSVATVAKISPPMTARPSGAFCSPLSPSPRAMGIMPMIMAAAVMMTGRSRVKPASSAASLALLPSVICSRAKLITSTLFAVATPMHMMAPVRAGTLTVVWVRNSIQTMPAKRGGQRGDDDQRIEQRLEIHDDEHVDQNDGADQPEQQTAERLLHGLDLALEVDGRPLGQILPGRIDAPC